MHTQIKKWRWEELEAKQKMIYPIHANRMEAEKFTFAELDS